MSHGPRVGTVLRFFIVIESHEPVPGWAALVWVSYIEVPYYLLMHKEDKTAAMQRT